LEGVYRRFALAAELADTAFALAIPRRHRRAAVFGKCSMESKGWI
jgi:hypothetical protein